MGMIAGLLVAFFVLSYLFTNSRPRNVEEVIGRSLLLASGGDNKRALALCESFIGDEASLCQMIRNSLQVPTEAGHMFTLLYWTGEYVRKATRNSAEAYKYLYPALQIIRRYPELLNRIEACEQNYIYQLNLGCAAEGVRNYGVACDALKEAVAACKAAIGAGKPAEPWTERLMKSYTYLAWAYLNTRDRNVLEDVRAALEAFEYDCAPIKAVSPVLKGQVAQAHGVLALYANKAVEARQCFKQALDLDQSSERAVRVSAYLCRPEPSCSEAIEIVFSDGVPPATEEPSSGCLPPLPEGV